uniref:Zn(2)-C6 fungal-type domain-containing protein n=1 Tax=Ganoderma boninense TaxID=34458 RepID=A0A5K1K1R6_9APHY|nr:Zn(2)-C6 fungal-type domain-containing protein [Ganoderma boninense]
MRSFSFLPCLLDRFSSLTTLLVRHSEIAYPETAASGIASLSRALRPKGDSGDDASDEQCDSSSDGCSDDDEEAVDTSSGSEDAVDLDQGDKSDDPHGTPSDAEAALNNAPTTFDRTSHIDSQTEATGAPRRVPAPQLRTVGLELKCNSLASLEPFARAIEARKTCGHPLDSVRCNLAGVDVEDLRAHVVDGVSEFDDKLWVPTVDEGWLVKNDYWRLYPARWENYSEWGLYMKKW